MKKPDLVILDEAFSGMDEGVRDKCMLFLTWGETRYFARSDKARTIAKSPGKALIGGLAEHQALICVSHIKEEVPGLVRQWICLPEANEGRPPRFGQFRGPLEGDRDGWGNVWQS